MAMKDRYGRSISAAEAAKRKRYRESTKGMSADRRVRARQTEMKRRASYRKGEGAKEFGAAAKKVTRPATAKGTLVNKKAAANRDATRFPRAAKAEVSKRATAQRMAMAEQSARRFQTAQYQAPRSSHGSARTSTSRFGVPGMRFIVPKVKAPKVRTVSFGGPGQRIKIPYTRIRFF